MMSNDAYKKDLKKLIQAFPEGVMVCQRFGTPQIKLWNKELMRMFRFSALPKSMHLSADKLKEGKQSNPVEGPHGESQGSLKHESGVTFKLPSQ